MLIRTTTAHDAITSCLAGCASIIQLRICYALIKGLYGADARQATDAVQTTRTFGTSIKHALAGAIRPATQARAGILLRVVGRAREDARLTLRVALHPDAARGRHGRIAHLLHCTAQEQAALVAHVVLDGAQVVACKNVSKKGQQEGESAVQPHSASAMPNATKSTSKVRMLPLVYSFFVKITVVIAKV